MPGRFCNDPFVSRLKAVERKRMPNLLNSGGRGNKTHISNTIQHDLPCSNTRKQNVDAKFIAQC